ncbi:hypothetical protein DSCO28_68260 [Desulfosarcina ovata subsp. sediminis]|uniref:PilZ domain-containing protein n=1 Tax=Desulfosarcina ovata subsp. sediminis TaxID=885957 RepID=A0A5K8A1X3_9BACT|nr:hypothetical protein [Desulfosarcina ovata]BBO86260.1 hypothetical protein DSCO28_68260 [Desulfosarcina ovata subsp. sediminis]
MDQKLGNRRRRRFQAQNLTISINGKSYRIFNINEYGVGFLIDTPEEIELNTEIQPMTVNGTPPIQVAGIPRHVSQLVSEDQRLFFQPGWVCGTEFTTQHDRDGGKLIAEFIAENIEREAEENES